MKLLQKLTISLILAGFVCCQNLQPDSIELPEYPDLGRLLIEQCNKLQDRSMTKEVMLGGETETLTLTIDSIRWKKELSFLEEINPRKPEYVGVYEVTEDANELTLKLGNGEKAVLKWLSIQSDETGNKKISATIHESKEIFTHHREVELTLSDGLISEWRIDGYHKMLISDTVRFRIIGSVN